MDAGDLVVLACRGVRSALPGASPGEVSARKGRIVSSRTACGSQITAGLLLRMVEGGARRILVVTCPEGDCRFLKGTSAAADAVAAARRLLEAAGTRGVTITHSTAGWRVDLEDLADSELRGRGDKAQERSAAGPARAGEVGSRGNR